MIPQALVIILFTVLFSLVPLGFFAVAFVWGRGFLRLLQVVSLERFSCGVAPFRFLFGVVQAAPAASAGSLSQLRLFVGLPVVFAVAHGVATLLFGFGSWVFAFSGAWGLFLLFAFSGAVVVAGLAFTARRFARSLLPLGVSLAE